MVQPGLVSKGMARYGFYGGVRPGDARWSAVGRGRVGHGHQGFLTGGNYGSSFRIKKVNIKFRVH